MGNWRRVWFDGGECFDLICECIWGFSKKTNASMLPLFCWALDRCSHHGGHAYIDSEVDVLFYRVLLFNLWKLKKNEKLQKALIIRHHGYIIRHYVLLWLFAIAIFWEIMVFQFKTIMKQEAMIRITACKNCRPIGTYSCNITE